MISYIFKAEETKDKRDFVQQLAKELTSMDEDHIMTIADEFRLEGKLEGLKEGELKGLKKGKLEGKLEDIVLPKINHNF